MDPATLIKLHSLISNAPSLFASRYLAIAAAVITLWDHMLTLTAEIELIWRGKFDFFKAIFVINRYFVEGTLIYVVYVMCVLRPPLQDSECKVFTLFVTIASVVTMALENFTITSRIQAIWDHRRHITYILTGGFVITHAIVVIFAGYVIKDLHAQSFYEPFVAQTCIISTRPTKLLGVWAGMVAYDVFVCMLVLLNALNQPYRQNTEILTSLQKDGIKFYVALTVVRVINLLLSIFTGAGQIFLIVFFVWALISITLSRLLLRIEAFRIGGSAVRVWKGDMFELTQYD